jgi:hypothetical protein
MKRMRLGVTGNTVFFLPFWEANIR